MTGSGAFCEMDEVEYTPRDIRYTMRDEYIYASALGKIGDKTALHHILPMVYKEEIESISVLGDGRPLTWTAKDDVLLIDTANVRKNNIATVLKIRERIFTDDGGVHMKLNGLNMSRQTKNYFRKGQHCRTSRFGSGILVIRSFWSRAGKSPPGKNCMMES